MKIYILLGHPDKDTFNGQIAQAYLESAKQKGHDVRIQYLGDMKFDPILWKGYKSSRDLEPDLKTAQENILWCEKWTIIYPIWWGSMPAILKGFFDKTLQSGFAFKYRENSPWWDKLLKGRTADIITTCDAPNIWISWVYRNSDLHSVKTATLKFCGIKPVRAKRLDGMRHRTETERQKILESIRAWVPKN